jgi:hypothetical protein
MLVTALGTLASLDKRLVLELLPRIFNETLALADFL